MDRRSHLVEESQSQPVLPCALYSSPFWRTTVSDFTGSVYFTQAIHGRSRSSSSSRSFFSLFSARFFSSLAWAITLLMAVWPRLSVHTGSSRLGLMQQSRTVRARLKSLAASLHACTALIQGRRSIGQLQCMKHVGMDCSRARMVARRVATITGLVPTSLPCHPKVLASVRLNLWLSLVRLAASSST